MSDKKGTAPVEHPAEHDDSVTTLFPLELPAFGLEVVVIICVIYLFGPKDHGDLIPNELFPIGYVDELVAGLIAWQAVAAHWRGASRLFRKMIFPEPDD